MLTTETNLLQRRRAWHESGHICCALVFSVPIISATIAGDRAFVLRNNYFAPTFDIGIEAMATLCLSGPAAEAAEFGEFHDGADAGDLAQAREVLARKYNVMEIGAALLRFRDAADKLVRSPFGQARIPVIARALLARGSLTGAEINELS